MWTRLRIVIPLAILSAGWLPAAPPATFMDEPGTKFITLEAFEGGKVSLSLRTVGGPGFYGRWLGAGQQMPRGIEFSQKLAEDQPPGPVYLATGGQGTLTVKLKPGQAGAMDAGLSGIYRHVSDDRIVQLAKKDCEGADKMLDDAIRAAALKAPSEDKVAYAEWRKAWRAMRDQLLALMVSKTSVMIPAAAATRPAATKPAASPPGSPAPEKLPAYWVQRAETTAAGVNFMNSGVPPGLKSGWEGNYEDGFGGSIQLFVVSNGDGRFTINAGRGPEGAGGTIEGKIPLKTFRDAPDGTSTGEFTDNNPQLKEGDQQTLLHFRRIGHFLIVESQYAERYAGRGWFDGIYIKRPPPKEE